MLHLHAGINREDRATTTLPGDNFIFNWTKIWLKFWPKNSGIFLEVEVVIDVASKLPFLSPTPKKSELGQFGRQKFCQIVE